MKNNLEDDMRVLELKLPRRIQHRVEPILGNGKHPSRSLIANSFILPLLQLLEMKLCRGRKGLQILPAYIRHSYSFGV